ncbi:MAG TPA: carboxymuconolactone decarboxylase family protein [Acetobacteraceae bacterium]|jgi:4-carboxymuconolactone decarboxylase
MPRIPLVTATSMTDAQRRVYDAMMSGPRRSPPVGPLAAAMHRPDLAEKWSDLGLVLRFNSSFEPRLREFVILLTGRFWDCQFEWFSHEAEARKAGLSEQTIETLRHGGGTFDVADEQAIHDYAIELLRDHHVRDATYQRILDAYGSAGIVELTALIGYYAMVAMTLNAHEIGVPEGATPPLPALPGHGAGD